MSKAALIFPHQLFIDHPALEGKPGAIVLLEEPLFFDDARYPAKFHKQKLAYHRTTMTRYAVHLDGEGFAVEHVHTRRSEAFLKEEIARLKARGTTELIVADPHDFTVSKRLHEAASEASIPLEIVPSPAFINTPDLNAEYRAGKKRWFMADFYKWQRKRLAIMMDENGEPEGGQWSFDEDNRKKVPKAKLADVPFVAPRNTDEWDDATLKDTHKTWPDHPGSIANLFYPTDHGGAAEWLDRFLHQRFASFGDYEDAIVEGENWLWHSVLTPMLNIGLLTPRQIVNATLEHCQKHDVPINAREGFLRQIIGWREFMRATYDDLGVTMRTTNHWNHTNPMPAAFYDGTTGIDPIDDTIKRILGTGYCHHIERLMVLGGFMFLCEIDPDDIYKWFMEMFIDAYDWVMVPNVYAMSQNADGGLITTKPYFSGSAYVKKMSHYKHGPWADTWDGLYWRWIWNHHEMLAKNPRWAMMVSQAKKMNDEKRANHIRNAEDFRSSFQ
ncbi:MAG: cryptochrome/photolyase family protein [Pseudomonadota bacterium]